MVLKLPFATKSEFEAAIDDVKWDCGTQPSLWESRALRPGEGFGLAALFLSAIVPRDLPLGRISPMSRYVPTFNDSEIRAT